LQLPPALELGHESQFALALAWESWGLWPGVVHWYQRGLGAETSCACRPISARRQRTGRSSSGAITRSMGPGVTGSMPRAFTACPWLLWTISPPTSICP